MVATTYSPSTAFEEVRMTPQEYAIYKGISVRTVYRYIERRLVTFEQLDKNFPVEIIVRRRIKL